MNLITIRKIYENREQYLSQEISVGGWVRSICGSGALGFIVVNDGSYFETLQTVYHDTMPNFDGICKLSIGVVIVVKGALAATPGARQPPETQATEVTMEGPSTSDYPLQGKYHSLEYLRTISHLRLRTNTFRAVSRVCSLTACAIHQYLRGRSFVHIHTPLITANDCEGAGEIFQVTTLGLDNIPKTEDGTVNLNRDFFNKPISLTISGQLNGETYIMASHSTCTFGPTFQTRNSNTTRHAAEFWVIEPKMASADLDGNMALTKGMLRYVIRYVLEHTPGEMNFFNQLVNKGLLECPNDVLNSEFGHVIYTETIKILEEYNDAFKCRVLWGCNLQTEHERYLTEETYKKPLSITDYSEEIKVFCMKLNDNSRAVVAIDCLVPGIGEAIGGSQREGNCGKLLSRMEELGSKPEDYKFYPDLRKYGSTRHSGFDLDSECCMIYLTDMDSIRDIIPLPKTVNNCDL